MRIFIFDLDDTLGRKSPPFPRITSDNVEGLRELASSPGALLCIATSRPRSLSAQGLAHGGMDSDEISSIFRIGVYEDGFFVKSGVSVIYDALDDMDPAFRDLRKMLFDDEAVRLFSKEGFLIVPGCDVSVEDGVYQSESYDGSVIGPLSVPDGMAVLYQQDNDVKSVYKFPKGYLSDDLKQQEPIMKKVGQLLTGQLTSRYPGWERIAQIVVWQDAIDLYPKLKDDEIFLKGHGLEVAFSGLDVPESSEVYICCDGSNDIAMVNWASVRFRDCTVVCPSNVSRELRDFLQSSDVAHYILEEDCTRFIDGLKKVLVSRGARGRV